eukprot:TRINITY_DN24713_c0_g1_i1.p1 TRINITY_DN24713_c0_g1~~TRINITY_DN24713_c0_g1_i1.p1  ORF type:complete len:888 (+),score=150.76 TRINITY_DN24713_c0_g1_i1:350-3013(+)
MTGGDATVTGSTRCYTPPSDLLPAKLLSRRYDSLSVGWEPPLKMNGSPLTGYSLEVSAGGVVRLAVDHQMVESVVVDGLLADTEYTCALVAHNQAGTSDPAVTLLSTGPPEPPEQLPPVQLMSCSWEHLEIGWDLQDFESTNGAPILWYTLTVTDMAGGGTESFDIKNPTATSCRCGELDASREYGLGIVAHNRAGPSVQSALSCFSTQMPPVPNRMEPPFLTAAHYHSLTAAWKPAVTPGCEPTGYSFRWRKAGEAQWHEEIQNALLRSITLYDLVPATDYQLSVNAHNITGPGPAGVTVVTTPAAPPEPVQGVSLTDSSWDSVSIGWETAVARGAAVTGYRVDFQIGANKEEWSSAHTDTPAFTLDSLQAQDQVWVRIWAVSTAGESEPSVVTRFHSGYAPCPSVMQPPVIDNLTWDSVTIAWCRDPSISPGAPITGYSLRWKAEVPKGVGNESWHRELYHADVSTFQLKGLVPDALHTVLLSAHNSSGSSPEVACESRPCSLPPLAPSPPVLVGSDQESLEIRWLEPQTRGSEVTGYTVCCTGRDGWCMVHQTSDAWFKLSGLEPLSKIGFTVAADSLAGLGETSGSCIGGTTRGATVEFSTAAPLPPEPIQMFKLVRVGFSEATVEWEAPGLRGCEVDGYSVTCFEKGDGEEEMRTVCQQEAGPTLRVHTVQGLEEQTKYVVVVQAMSSAGKSRASPAIGFQTAEQFPIPYARIVDIINAMSNDILRGQVQDDGCSSLVEIASQHSHWAIAVAQLGGLAACVRAKRAYPASAQIQAGGDALLERLCRHPDGGLLVLKAYSGIFRALVDMTAIPWAMNTQATARHILARFQKECGTHALHDTLISSDEEPAATRLRRMSVGAGNAQFHSDGEIRSTMRLPSERQ